MFKLNRYKSDRLGEKVDFRFSSFQAFQIPKGWDRLVLSMVSVDTGKTVAKAGKATVRSGTCQWTENFSESIWIPKDGASKDIEESVFKLVISMGSLRSGILGELVINLADYISSHDSGSLSFPLRKCNYGTIMQVRIQCLNPKKGLRDMKSSKETSAHLEALHSKNNGENGKSDGSAMYNRSLLSLSNNHIGVTCPDDPLNRDTSFSASGSHRSSDSGDNSIGRLNFSPRNNVNGGGSYMGRQDSASSHVSGTSSVGPVEDTSRSNPSSFNSRASGSSTPNRWQESTVQASSQVLAPTSLRASGSSKDILEAAEETIEELQDEAKMWERHAQKLKQDIDKLKKESSQKSKRQAELDMELSTACSERDSLKQEVQKLKSSLEEETKKLTATRSYRNGGALCVQKELEEEIKYLKESNANLSHQLNKSQEANLELVSILEELEETVEKQKLEMEKLERYNIPQQSPVSENDGDMWNKKLLDIEAEWAHKLSAKEEEVRKLEEKLSSMVNADFSIGRESSSDHLLLMKEIEDLRGKVQELERDCAELTDENLDLLYKIKQSGMGIKEEDTENSDSEAVFLKSKIHRLEEELRRKEMLAGGLTETSKIEMKNLEKKCANLELELQYFKDQVSCLDIKLHESQLEVEGKMSELSELQQKLESFQNTELGNLDYIAGMKDTCRQDAETDSNVEELKFALTLKQKEIDSLRQNNLKLEATIENRQSDENLLEENLASALRESNTASKCLADVKHEMTLLASNVDSHTSTNKMLERKLMELESSKHELETLVSELEGENVQLSERISGLEAQLRYMTNEKESNRLDLEDARSLVEEHKNELARFQAALEAQGDDQRQKLLNSQKLFSEAQEEMEYLRRSHSKLQSTIESLIEENNSLQKSNGDLRRQKLELHEHGSHLEMELSEAQKKTSGFLDKVELLELKLTSMQSDIISREKFLTSQLENVFQEQGDQAEKISQAKLMLNQIEAENTVKVENLKREVAHLSSQLCATHDERQKMASDAVLEVSSLRSDKIKLENNLLETQAKAKRYETELQSVKQESGKKVQGLVDLLNASKQSEEMLMSDLQHMQMQADAAKSSEEKFKRLASELEVKLKTSDYEKQQIVEELSSLKIQVQMIAHLQDEILVFKTSLKEANFEKGKVEELLHSVSEECERLKADRTSLMERITNMQKALDDGEDSKRTRITLEEKVLRLEGDLSAKEASYAHEAELKNELNRIKRTNSEYQRKVQCLEEENCELMRKAQLLKKEGKQDLGDLEMPSSGHHPRNLLNEDAVQLANGNQRQDDPKLDELEATIDKLKAKVQDLEAKIWLLENDLAKSLWTNDMYKSQLQGLREQKQSSNGEVPTNTSEDDTGLQAAANITSLEAELTYAQQASKIASLEAELKDMKERYLHMSLQYAEVEAERQELVLKMKTSAKGKGWFS